jgi:hypothetical protein
LQLTEKGSSENFNSAFEAELADHIPVVKCSIAGTRVIGRTIVGTYTCTMSTLLLFFHETPYLCLAYLIFHQFITSSLMFEIYLCYQRENEKAIAEDYWSQVHALMVSFNI